MVQPDSILIVPCYAHICLYTCMGRHMSVFVLNFGAKPVCFLKVLHKLNEINLKHQFLFQLDISAPTSFMEHRLIVPRG